MGFGKTGAVGSTQPVASLHEIARVLEETSRLIRQHANWSGDISTGQPPNLVGTYVRAMIALRAARGRYLGFDANDATWSMILELYAARQDGKRVHQTRLGVVAGVPQTTALSVTRKMLRAGIFTRATDPDDKRLLLLGLSDDTAGRIDRYLAAAREVGISFLIHPNLTRSLHRPRTSLPLCHGATMEGTGLHGAGDAPAPHRSPRSR
jgi:hypothetical protein